MGSSTELIMNLDDFFQVGEIGESSSATVFWKAEENLTYKLVSRGLVFGVLS